MKQLLHIFSAASIILGMASCANGKKLQEEPPVALQEAYYTTWTSGAKGADSGFSLFIPAEDNLGVELDSVYFRGRKAAIEKSGAAENLYVAYFKIPSDEGKARDVIMHVDPKKEYGNKPPQLPEKIPFQLEEGEAVVKYTRNGKEKYFRITGIKKRDTADVEIKKPENIRH
jgi:hypothetical protein